MNIEQKQQLIEKYIRTLVARINGRYPNIVTDEKLARGIEIFKGSQYTSKFNNEQEFNTYVVPEINEAAKQHVANILKKQEEDRKKKQEQPQPMQQQVQPQPSNGPKKESFTQRSPEEIRTAQEIKDKNKGIKNTKKHTAVKTLGTYPQPGQNNGGSSNKGYANTIILSFFACFVAGALFMIIYLLIRGK